MSFACQWGSIICMHNAYHLYICYMNKWYTLYIKHHITCALKSIKHVYTVKTNPQKPSKKVENQNKYKKKHSWWMSLTIKINIACHDMVGIKEEDSPSFLILGSELIWESHNSLICGVFKSGNAIVRRLITASYMHFQSSQ